MTSLRPWPAKRSGSSEARWNRGYRDGTGQHDRIIKEHLCNGTRPSIHCDSVFSLFNLGELAFGTVEDDEVRFVGFH